MAETKNKLPKHIAIIMDGNRRWAKKSGINALLGHDEGYQRFVDISKHCKELGIKILTVYALSSENLKGRTKKELAALFRLLRNAIKKEEKRLIDLDIKLKIIGRREGLSDDLLEAFDRVEERTKNNKSGILNVALNYGGRHEIVDAIKKIVQKGLTQSDIDENIISKFMYTEDQDDPDLIIRSGGKYRTSNFLPWQGVYSEFYFTDTLWPDFTIDELKKAIDFYQMTQRNFGS